MRAPAPVQHPVASGGFWWAAWQGLTLVVAAAVMAWWASAWQQGESSWRQAGATGLTGLILIWSWSGLRSLRALDALIWDGQGWHLHNRTGQSSTGRVRVSLDLGPWMLLHWQPDAGQVGRALELPMARVDGLQGWQRLRLAVHAPTSPPSTTPVPGWTP